MKIEWEQAPNPDVKTMHCGREIPSRDPKLRDEETECGKLILALPGVVSFWFDNRYSLTIEKGKCFDWPGIQQDVERVVRKFVD